MIRAPRATRALLAAALCLGACGACQASSAGQSYCERRTDTNAAAKDRLLRFGAVIKAELDNSGGSMALISRSGLDLGRFGVRYSHAGVSLKASENTPWSVRQLYYACDEQRPRLFDEGMAGFVLGTQDPALGYVSIVLLPPAQAAALEKAALDNRQALQLLGASYSANAFPFDTRYQNCNQWVAELLAVAWGGLAAQADGAPPRAQAQRWLQQQGYVPTVFDVGSRLLMWAGVFIPFLHRDDHPAQDTDALRYRVSMPASIEGFVQGMVPGAQRIEFCHSASQVVVRRGWEPLPEGCVAGAGDTVIGLD